MKYSRATTAVLGAEHVVPVEVRALAKGRCGQRVTGVASQATWPRTVLREWAVADNNKQMLQEGSFVVKAKARTGRKTSCKGKLQCVICGGHGHTSAQRPMRSLHSVVESER